MSRIRLKGKLGENPSLKHSRSSLEHPEKDILSRSRGSVSLERPLTTCRIMRQTRYQDIVWNVFDTDEGWYLHAHRAHLDCAAERDGLAV